MGSDPESLLCMCIYSIFENHCYQLTIIILPAAHDGRIEGEDKEGKGGCRPRQGHAVGQPRCEVTSLLLSALTRCVTGHSLSLTPGSATHRDLSSLERCEAGAGSYLVTGPEPEARHLN